MRLPLNLHSHRKSGSTSRAAAGRPVGECPVRADFAPSPSRKESGGHLLHLRARHAPLPEFHT